MKSFLGFTILLVLIIIISCGTEPSNNNKVINLEIKTSEDSQKLLDKLNLLVINPQKPKISSVNKQISLLGFLEVSSKLDSLIKEFKASLLKSPENMFIKSRIDRPGFYSYTFYFENFRNEQGVVFGSLEISGPKLNLNLHFDLQDFNQKRAQVNFHLNLKQSSERKIIIYSHKYFDFDQGPLSRKLSLNESPDGQKYFNFIFKDKPGSSLLHFIKANWDSENILKTETIAFDLNLKKTFKVKRFECELNKAF